MNGAPTVRFEFDGHEVATWPGTTVAAALLAAGITTLRSTAVSDAARGPFCMMGTCFDCLVRVNGKTLQACMIEATEGLVVERGKGKTE